VSVALVSSAPAAVPGQPVTFTPTVTGGMTANYSGVTASVTQQVVTATPESDPQNPTQQALYVGGTTGNDLILVALRSDPPLSVRVRRALCLGRSGRQKRRHVKAASTSPKWRWRTCRASGLKRGCQRSQFMRN
jgi:hypothetical protein